MVTMEMKLSWAALNTSIIMVRTIILCKVKCPHRTPLRLNGLSHMISEMKVHDLMSVLKKKQCI